MEALFLASSVWSRMGQSIWFALIAVVAAIFLLASLVFGHDTDTMWITTSTMTSITTWITTAPRA